MSNKSAAIPTSANYDQQILVCQYMEQFDSIDGNVLGVHLQIPLESKLGEQINKWRGGGEDRKGRRNCELISHHPICLSRREYNGNRCRGL